MTAPGRITFQTTVTVEKVTARRPDWWAPQFALGQHYAQARKKDEGITALKITLRLAPECRAARTMLSFLDNLKDEGDDSP